MTKEEIALQLTLSALENDYITKYIDDFYQTTNKNIANGAASNIASFYNTLLEELSPNQE